MPDENGHKLLLVDDEQLILDVCGAVLTNSGYRVICARSAKIGLSVFCEEPRSIEMVISDLLLPDMSGPDMVHRMRAEKSGLKAIFMSGYGAGNVIPASTESGSQLIVKPFTSDHFLRLVRNTMEGRLAASSRR